MEAHLAYLFVRGAGADAIRGFDSHGAAGTFNRGTQLAENLNHVVRVGYVRHAGYSHGLICEQSCCQNGQGGILGTADVNGAAESVTTFNDEFVHGCNVLNYFDVCILPYRVRFASLLCHILTHMGNFVQKKAPGINLGAF